MKELAQTVTYVAFVITWISGIIIANGFFSTLVAVFIPLWGWYLLLERIMQTIGLISCSIKL